MINKMIYNLSVLLIIDIYTSCYF